MKRILPVSFFVVICFLTLGCEEERKGQFLERGIVFFDQGKYKESELEIKSAIQEDPLLSEPYYYMALLNEKEKKYKAMKANLLESVKLDPEKIKARLKLSKVHLLFNEVDEASQEIETVLNKNPEQLEALAIKASILIRQKKIEDALLIIDQVLAKAPEHIEALSLKVVVMMRQKQLDKALALLSPAIEKHKDNVSLILLKIQLDSQLENVDAIVKDYERLAELKPDNAQVKLTLAKVYQKAKQLEKAENILIQLVDQNPEQINFKIALLDFIFAMDEVRAMTQFDVFAGQSKDDYQKLIVFANWLLAKNRSSQAREFVKTNISNNNISDKDKGGLTLFLAQMDLSTGHYNDALVLINKVLKENAEDLQAKLLKSEVQIATAEYNDAKTLLEEILWQKPEMDKALSLLGEVNEVQGDIDKATINYQNALKINPRNLQAVNFIVNKELAEGHGDYAVDVLEKALRFLPTQLMLLTKLVELHVNEGHWDKAEEYINRIQAQKNGVLLAEYLRGKVLQQQKKYQQAISVYKSLLDKAPWLKDALNGLIVSHVQIKQQPELLLYLDEMLKKHPNVIFPYIAKSQLLSAGGNSKKAIAFMQGVLKNDRIMDKAIYLELGRLYDISGDKEAELNMYLEGLKLDSNDISLMLRLASSYEGAKKIDQAVALYERILLKNPRHNVSKNNLATLLVDQYGEVEHINKAASLVESFKQAKQPYFLDTYGWVKLKSGAVDDALSIFKKVIILEPNVPVFRYHLAVAYAAINDKMAARSELKQALYIGKGKKFAEKVLIEALLTKLNAK